MNTILHSVADYAERTFRSKIFILLFGLLANLCAHGQFLFSHPVPWEVVAGDQMVGGFHVTMDLGPSPLTNGQRYADDCIVITPRHIYVQGVLGNEKFYDVARLPDTSDYTMTDIIPKLKRDSSEFLTILTTLSNGGYMQTVIRYPIDSTGLFPYAILKKVYRPSDTANYAKIKKAVGDDLYQWDQSGANDYIYVSHDTGATWHIDTTGLHGVRLYDIAVDTAQNVWLATANGLMKQPLAGSTWSVSSCPIQPSLTYVDSRGRLWVAGSYQLYYTADQGATWHQNSSPPPGPIFKLSDDPFGNIYALVNNTYSLTYGDKVYKSVGGTGAFARIDQNLATLNAQVDDSAAYAFVMGDSTHIYIGGIMGMHGSTDGGATWQPVGIVSEKIFGLVQANNGDLLMTNNLACYKSPAVGVTWSKTYPQNGYAGSRPIYKDDAGTLYTQGASLSSIYTSVGPYMTVKSTDNGLTWTPDTAGISQTKMYVWWVDESGGQHGCSLYMRPQLLYYKPSGGAWALDTAGLSRDSLANYVGAFGSDHNGHVYVSTGSGNILSRPIAGGTWTLETGVNGDQIYSLAHTSNHTMIAGGNSDAHYKSGSTWQTMPINAPAPYGVNKFAVAADDSDYVWVAFSHQGSGGNYVGDGVFYTHDFGNTWYSPSGNLNVVTFRSLVPMGDSVFAISYGNGIFILKRDNNATGIMESLSQHHLVVYPNPASAEFHILYALPGSAGDVWLSLYDISGRLAKRIKLDPSAVQSTINVAGMAKGIYSCTLSADGRVMESDKIVIR